MSRKILKSITNTAAVQTAFYNSPDDALFDQQVISVVIGFSTFWLERKRWERGGIPYSKMGKSVRYKKGDVMAWLAEFNQPQPVSGQQPEKIPA